VFEEGRVQLTLCIGEVPAIAREIDIAADSICIDLLDAWGAKQIVRLCKRGTLLSWQHASADSLTDLQQAGVKINTQKPSGVFEPNWSPKSSLRSSQTQQQATQNNDKHVVVIGAGLSGAAVAYSLAIRGWNVKVVDQGHSLGAGASGLPAGLFATHVSPDNNVLSRITRDGVRATMQRASQLLIDGTHWQVSQLLEHRYAGKRQLPNGAEWPAAGHTWSTDATEAQKVAGGLQSDSPALWHPLAGWVQTPAFVKAQLTHPNITWRTHCAVHQLKKTNEQWHLLDKAGESLAVAHDVILANAHQCQGLLETVQIETKNSAITRPLIPATALRGQVTLGAMANLPESLQHKLPSFPVNGHGSYIGNVTTLTSTSTENSGLWVRVFSAMISTQHPDKPI
jgi:tRNA 5-methylaminomethyl-2-thiouridine biosynthesis bifunctional protein